jgi:hypothetical protein
LNAVGAAAEVDLVQVQLQDLAFAVAVLDLARDAHLAELAPQRFLVRRQLLGKEVARQLHRDRARAFLESTRPDVLHEGTRDAPPIDAVVGPETFVLDGDERVGHVLRQGIEADYDATLDEELADFFTIAIEQH